MNRDTSEVLAKKAWDLFNAKKWQEAGVLFQQLMDSDPEDDGGFQGRIACYRLLNESENAKALIDSALKSHPRSVGILCERAWLDYGLKKFGEAINDFSAVLLVTRENAELFSWKVSLLRAEHRFDEADQAVHDALKLFAGDYSLMIELAWLRFYQNRLDEAAIAFESILEKYKDNEIALQGKIACLRVGGNFELARIEAERAAKRSKRPSPGILSEMAWLGYEQERYDEAVKKFREVILADPNDAYARVNLAVALIKQDWTGCLKVASDECRDAIALNPTLPEAWGCLGIIALKQGRLAEAEAQLRQSIVGDSRGGDYADLGALYIQMGRYEEATAVLMKGVKVKPEDGSVHLELGNLYLQIENYGAAIAEFRQAKALDPRNPDPIRALAIALMESGKLREAESVLRTGIRTLDESKRWRLHLTLCQLLARLGEDTGDQDLCAEALIEASTALRISAGSADPHFFSGIVRFKLDDYQGALNCFRNCQKIDPSRIDAEINARRIKALLRRDRVRSKTTLITSAILGGIMLAQLALLWWLRIKYGLRERNALVTPTMLTVLVPICLGLIVVSILLPYLSKLKLTGLEAELSQPTAKDSLTSGPKGDIDFGADFLNVSGAATRHNVTGYPQVDVSVLTASSPPL